MLEMTAILGNLGNFVGAIGVVGSLVYLAVQVRQSREATRANTRALDDGRRLALAQTYQLRSAALQEMFLFVAGSEDIAEIYAKLADPNVPDDAARAAFNNLTPAQRARWQTYLSAHRIRLDNLVFQHQQGLLTDEYFESGVKEPLRRFARLWEIAGIPIESLSRPSFAAVLREAQKNTA